MTGQKQLSIGESFLSLFETVKSKCEDNPEQVNCCYQENTKFRDIVRELNILADCIDRHLHTHPQKYIAPVLDDFPEQWGAFKKDWQKELADAWITFVIRDLKFDMLDFGTSEEDSMQKDTAATVQDTQNSHNNIFEEPDYDDDDFNPAKHNPASILKSGLEFLFQRFRECDAEYMIEDGYERIVNEVCMSEQAFKYFEESIGLDLDNIAARWKKTPHVYFPSHISNKHGSDEKDSLYDLLSDAYRSYTFGLFRPCIVMCRAITETVLEKHYPYEYPDKDRKSLMKLILSAIDREKKEQPVSDFSRIGLLRWLERITKHTNNILHINRQGNYISDEETALSYLTALKILIETAPAKEQKKKNL